MAIPIPLLIAGAGILSSLLKSQQYYPAAEAPTKTQIYGDAAGAGLGGLLGGSVLGGGGGGGGGIMELLGLGGGGDPGAATGAGAAASPLQAGGGLGNEDLAMLDFLTNGGITGRGFGGSTGGLSSILASLGQQGSVPVASRAPAQMVPGGILAGVR